MCTILEELQLHKSPVVHWCPPQNVWYRDIPTNKRELIMDFEITEDVRLFLLNVPSGCCAENHHINSGVTVTVVSCSFYVDVVKQEVQRFSLFWEKPSGLGHMPQTHSLGKPQSWALL